MLCDSDNISRRIIFIENIKNFDIDFNIAEFVSIDCKLCETKEKLFDVFKHKLNFPNYFGNNWDAFDECIHDLEWLGKMSVYIYLKNLSNVLKEAENDRKIFLEIINEDYFVDKNSEIDKLNFPVDIYFLVDFSNKYLFRDLNSVIIYGNN